MSPAALTEAGRNVGRRAKTFSQRLYDWLFGRGRELPLQADGIAIALAALLGIMVYLAALGLSAGTVLGDLAATWEQARAGELTVEVRPLDPRVAAGAPSMNARVGASLAALKAIPGVVRATPLGEDEMRRLLSPWLGEDMNFQDLPLPVLITVEVQPTSGPAGDQSQADVVDAISTRLTKSIPGLRIDDHGAWLKELRRFVDILQLVAIAIIALLGLAASLTVILVTRVSLLAHRDVVDILHVMGATDRHIAWQFQTFVARIAAVGSAGGAIFAFLTVLVAQLCGMALTAPLLPAVALPWWFFVMILILPLPVVLLAAMVARSAVLWWVRQLP